MNGAFTLLQKATQDFINSSPGDLPVYVDLRKQNGVQVVMPVCHWEANGIQEVMPVCHTLH